MGRVFHVCSEAGDVLLCTVAGEDTSPIETSMGPQAASTLVGSTPSEFTFPGVDADGDVKVLAFFGGLPGDQHQVSIGEGPTGGGNENLPLRLELTGSAPAWEVAVLYATDGAGDSVTPTGTEVANLLNTDPAVETVVEAELPGSGASDVVAAALTPLAGGIDDGDWLKFSGHAPTCRRINRAKVS
jgi:hypothetical protein